MPGRRNLTLLVAVSVFVAACSGSGGTSSAPDSAPPSATAPATAPTATATASARPAPSDTPTAAPTPAPTPTASAQSLPSGWTSVAVPKDSYAFGAPAGWAVVTRNDPAAAVAAIQQLEKEHPAAKGLLQQIAQAFDPSQESTGSAYLLRFEGSSMQQIPIWVDVPTKSDPATFAKQTAEGITTSLKELGVTTVVKTSTVENVPPIVRLEYTRAPGRVVVQYMVLGAKHLYTVNGDTKLDSLAQQVAKSLQELP